MFKYWVSKTSYSVSKPAKLSPQSWDFLVANAHISKYFKQVNSSY